jgi:hypothetical protein
MIPETYMYVPYSYYKIISFVMLFVMIKAKAGTN